MDSMLRQQETMLDGTNVCMPENENMFYSKYFTHECFGSETYGIPCEREIDFSKFFT